MLIAGLIRACRCGADTPSFEELLHAFDTRPPVQRNEVGDERKDKGAFTKEDFPLSQNGSVRGGTLPYPAFTFGDGGSCDGLVDDTINAENLYSKYPFPTTSLIFMWIIAGRGCRGTGWTVLENRYSTGFTITNFVWTISLYLSNATGYVVQEAYKLDFINDMADSIGKAYRPLQALPRTAFFYGLLCWFPASHYLSGGNVCLPIRDLSNGKPARHFTLLSTLWWCSCCPLRFIAYAPDYIKKINEFSSRHQYRFFGLGNKNHAPQLRQRGQGQRGLDTGQPIFYSSGTAVATSSIR